MNILTNVKNFARIYEHFMWKRIEVVITGLTRNQLYLTVPWVRIPPLPPEKKQPLSTKTKAVSFQLSVPYGPISTPSVREAMLRIVKRLRAWVAHLTSHRAQARCFTAAPPLLHLAQPNSTINCRGFLRSVENFIVL